MIVLASVDARSEAAVEVPFSEAGHSVLGRMLDVIDHEHVNRTSGRLQFEPELLLESLKEGWSCIFRLRAEWLDWIGRQ